MAAQLATFYPLIWKSISTCTTPLSEKRVTGDRQTLADLADGELIDKFCASGCEDCFEQLINRYKNRVYRLVLSVLGSSSIAEAEDITQDTFLVLFKRLSTLRRDTQIGPWLSSVAYHRAIDLTRRGRRRFTHAHSDTLEAVSSVGVSSNPLGQSLAAERQRLILSYVDGLSPPAPEVVRLFYWSGLTVEEIGACLTMKVGTVKAHLFRARRRLQEKLEEL